MSSTSRTKVIDRERHLSRRAALLAIASSATSVTVMGCSRQQIDQAVANTSTETIENARLSLRGFQIVAFTVGHRVVTLPHPAVRILGVALLTSGVVTYLVVEYLDIELKRREFREQLTDPERTEIESKQAVEFQTENGLTETVALGPNRYESDQP